MLKSIITGVISYTIFPSKRLGIKYRECMQELSQTGAGLTEDDMEQGFVNPISIFLVSNFNIHN